MFNKKNIVLASVLLLITAISLNSCKKEVTRIEPEAPGNNPYDGIDYGNNPDEIPVDSASYLGLYKYLFTPKCGVPGCHDGSFEPDFRTIEGSYNQLVYHSVIKNNATNDFTYRVLPGDTASSWLHERITTGDANLGKMPLYDVMSDHDINLIGKWILNGAKNVFDVAPSQPNLQPSSGGVLAYLNDTSGIRLDTIRDNVVAPMHLPQNANVQLWFLLYDTDQNGDFFPGYNFTYNKIKISDHPFDFSGVSYNSLNVLSPLAPANLPLPFGGGNVPFFYHNYMLNTANYIPGKTYYFRVYIKDSNHTFNTEIPKIGSPIYLTTYFSFIVQ